MEVLQAYVRSTSDDYGGRKYYFDSSVLSMPGVLA